MIEQHWKQGRRCGLSYSKGVYRKMIEMVYRGKEGNGNDEKKLPKNVRQIGEAGKGKKIYLEDYAITYIHQVEASVLLGESWEKDGSRYIFIHGAIQVADTEFGENIWEEVYRDTREYFQDSEILGWAMQVQEETEASDKKINRIFKAHFDREDTVLLLYEAAEKEDTVFAEENGALKKAGGYYVYYDKNKSMQEYMICKNAGKSVEKEQAVADKAIKNFRKMSEEKKDRQGKEKEAAKQPKNVRFLYAASTFLVLTIMVIAVTMINNYDKMKTMEQALSNLAGSTEAAAPANALVKEEADDMAKGEARETEQGEAKETASEETGGMGGTEALASSDGTLQEEASVPSENNGEQAAGAEEAVGTETKEASSSGVRPQQASYTVKDGDTLMDICRMYYGTDEKLKELCEFNDIKDPNSIVPGQKIKLP